MALLVIVHARLDAVPAAVALIPAVVCAMWCWLSAERHVSATADAVDDAILRLGKAARGDLESAIPRSVWSRVPTLARAMKGLFQQLRGTLDAVERAARIDGVTGLPNRSYFEQLVEERLAWLTRTRPGDSAAFLFVDLDRFKTVNDTYGHATGDLLLAEVGKRLSDAAGRIAGDSGEDAPIIGRLGGDEFTVLLSGPAARTPQATARAIVAALDVPYRIFGREVPAGASIGISCWPEHGATLTELTRAADTAMYAAKADGRGQAHSFDSRLAAALATRDRLTADLRAAVARTEFGLVFQPQVLAAGGRPAGAEALLRWHHAEGVRLPGSFLSCAEETGLIVQIGDQIVQQVAATIARWHALGIRHRLSVNISARELDHASFMRTLRDAITAAGAPVSMLELEFKESLLMRCSDEALETLRYLREAGAGIALDGFGTGFSSIARLRELPIDRMKLDRSLTRHIARCENARTIAQAVIALVHGLGCTAIAEGVEGPDQAAVLRMIDCDVLQGYAVAPPMAEQDFLAWLREQDAGSRLAG